MNLFQVRAKKCLRWPAIFTSIPTKRKFTRRGRETYQLNNPTYRTNQAGFVVDLDSPGEEFFCRADMRNLEKVAKADVKDAVALLEAQGPITFQPVLDYLEERGLAEKTSRPAPVAVAPDMTPLKKLKEADLQAVCDRLELPHGKCAEMREAIADKCDCSMGDTVAINEEGSVTVTEAA